MTDRNIVDEWPGEEDRQGGKGGNGSWRRGGARGLHLQQIAEPEEEETYSGVGTELRAERQRRQLSIADVGTALRIQQAHLLALEEGRTDDLPGPTYAIGFLRSYSEYLDLDSDETIRQFKEEATLVPVERRLVFPEPLDEARRPGLRTAIVSLLVAGAVYGGWIFLERQGLMPIETVAEPPQRFAPYHAADDEAIAPATAAAAVDAANEKADAALATTKSETAGPNTNEAEPAAASGQPNVPAETVVAAPVQPAQPEKQLADARMAGQAPMMEKQPSAESEAATVQASGLSGATDMPVTASASNTGVSIGDMPGSSNLPAAHDAPATEAASESANRPTAENRTALAANTVDNISVRPAASAREGADLNTAPTMPSVQAAMDPPPPPAAPAESTRPLANVANADTTQVGTGQASRNAATDGLGYRPQAYGASNRDSRVVLRALAESWVQVQGANNELLLTRMLRPGDSYHAPNRTDLVLMTGNAGAIEIIVDGEALGTLGPIGQVRRNIKLNADELRGQVQPSVNSSP